jgi:putative FmdB family regulatory protein
MPIYEYECRACGSRLEKLQKIKDDPLRDCPSCSKPELTKLVSAALFRLKGGGWYETDFKTGGKKNALHGGDSGSDSGSASSGDAGSGSGPATVSDTPKTEKKPAESTGASATAS